MTPRIDANPLGNLAQGFNPGDRTESQFGTLAGIQVEVKDEASMLADAAEEVSLLASEKVEQKTHAERSVKTEERPRMVRIEQINTYLEKAKSGSTPEELVMLAKRLLQQGEQNPARLARQSEKFRNPTEQYLLLQYARQIGPAEGASPEVLERIEDALADMEAWFGKVITTNLATIDQAAQYADTAQEVQAFQGSLNVVLGKPSISQALQEVLKLAGQSGAKLEGALSNLMEALGACLAATRSATEKVLLESLITDLYHLKSIKTLLEDCKQLVRNLKRKNRDQGQKRQGGQGQHEDGEPVDET